MDTLTEMPAQARFILSETDIAAELPPAAVPTPPEARLTMPAQSLSRFDPKKDRARAAPRADFVTFLARILVFGGAFVLGAAFAGLFSAIAVPRSDGPLILLD